MVLGHADPDQRVVKCCRSKWMGGMECGIGMTPGEVLALE